MDLIEAMSQPRPVGRARVRRAAPFALMALLATASVLLPPGPRHPGWVTAGAVAYAILLGLEVGLPWRRLPAWADGIPLIASYLPLAALRHSSGGDDSGLSLVAMVPVIGTALYGTRRNVTLAIGAGIATFVAPTLILGPPLYGPQDFRRALLWTSVAILLTAVVQPLVEHHHAQLQQLDVLAKLTRTLHTDPDPRTAICRAAMQVTGADGAYLMEPDSTHHLRTTARVGTDMPDISIDMARESSITVTALRQRRHIFIADMPTQAGASPRIAAATGAASAAWQPVFAVDGAGVGVLSLVFHRPTARLPQGAAALLDTLAAEAAHAIERGDLLRRLADNAGRDRLTGVANRRRWDEYLATEISAAEIAATQAQQRPLTIALLDLDHFKNYNDTHGHLAGDELLHDFAAAGAATLRPGDTFARWGGEEFALALPGCTTADALAVVERIRSSVPHAQTCTIGVAQWHPGDSAEELLARADAALYRGKKNGRNIIVLAEEEPRRSHACAADRTSTPAS